MGNPRRQTYHLVASTNEDSDRSAVGAFFNDQHLLSCGAKGHLTHTTSGTQLVRAQVLEPRHNTAVCRDGNQLNLGATNPPDGGQFVLEEQVVGLVIETPLADNKIGPSVLEVLDHLSELVPLVILELLELLDRSNVELVLGLRLWRFEGAGQDGQLGILYLIRHLGVGEILVDDNTLHEQRILKRTSDLAVHLDQFEVDVLALKVRNREHGIDSNLGELVVRLGDTVKQSEKTTCRPTMLMFNLHLAAQAGLGNLEKVAGIVECEGNFVADLVQLCHGDLARLVITVGYPNRVDTLVNQLRSLLQHGRRQNHHTRCAITDFLVLGFRKLDQ